MTSPPTAAIVVTYHPTLEMIETLTRTVSMVDLLIVVDNHSPADRRFALRSALDLPKGSLIELDRNEGIAFALNRGVERAIELGAEFLLLLDQDSQPEPGFVESLQKAALKDPVDAHRVLYSARHFSQKTGRPIANFLAPDGTPFIVITSGSFLHKSLYKNVGPFDESLFIDMVDDEYCLRLRRLGGSIRVADGANLFHEIGDPEQHLLFGRYRFSTLNHSAKRRYFIVRNRLLVLKKYIADYPAYTKYLLRETVVETIKIGLVPKFRGSRLLLSAKGFLDALLNRRGNRVGL